MWHLGTKWFLLVGHAHAHAQTPKPFYTTKPPPGLDNPIYPPKQAIYKDSDELHAEIRAGMEGRKKGVEASNEVLKTKLGQRLPAVSAVLGPVDPQYALSRLDVAMANLKQAEGVAAGIAAEQQQLPNQVTADTQRLAKGGLWKAVIDAHQRVDADQYQKLKGRKETDAKANLGLEEIRRLSKVNQAQMGTRELRAENEKKIALQAERTGPAQLIQQDNHLKEMIQLGEGQQEAMDNWQADAQTAALHHPGLLESLTAGGAAKEMHELEALRNGDELTISAQSEEKAKDMEAQVEYRLNELRDAQQYHVDRQKLEALDQNLKVNQNYAQFNDVFASSNAEFELASSRAFLKGDQGRSALLSVVDQAGNARASDADNQTQRLLNTRQTNQNQEEDLSAILEDERKAERTNNVGVNHFSAAQARKEDAFSYQQLKPSKESQDILELEQQTNNLLTQNLERDSSEAAQSARLELLNREEENIRQRRNQGLLTAQQEQNLKARLDRRRKLLETQKAASEARGKIQANHSRQAAINHAKYLEQRKLITAQRVNQTHMSDEQKDQVVKQQVKELEALRRTYEKAQQDLKDQQTKELGLLQDEQTKLQGVLEGELLGVERESQKTQDSLTLLSTQQKGQEEAKNAQAVSAEITKTSAHLQELLNIRASRLEDLRAVTDAIRQDEIRHGEALQASYTRENLRQQEAELHEFQILRDSSRELRQKADDAKRDMMTYTKEFDALRQAQNQRQQDILRNQKTIFRAQMDEANQVLREAEEFNRRRQHDCLQAARQRLGEAQDQLRNGQQYWRRWDDLVREHVSNTQANEARLIQQEDESRVTQKNQLLINTQVESDRHESLRHQDLQAFKKDVSTKENLENTGATNSLRQDPLNTSGLKVSRGSRAHKVTQLEAQADQVLASLKESTQKTGKKHKLNLMQGIETAIQISQLVDQHNSHLTHAHRMKASLVADQKLKRVSEREQSLMERRKATAKLVNFSGTT